MSSVACLGNSGWYNAGPYIISGKYNPEEVDEIMYGLHTGDIGEEEAALAGIWDRRNEFPDFVEEASDHQECEECVDEDSEMYPCDESFEIFEKVLNRKKFNLKRSPYVKAPIYQQPKEISDSEGDDETTGTDKKKRKRPGKPGRSESKYKKSDYNQARENREF